MFSLSAISARWANILECVVFPFWHLLDNVVNYLIDEVFVFDLHIRGPPLHGYIPQSRNLCRLKDPCESHSWFLCVIWFSFNGLCVWQSSLTRLVMCGKLPGTLVAVLSSLCAHAQSNHFFYYPFYPDVTCEKRYQAIVALLYWKNRSLGRDLVMKLGTPTWCND